MKKKICFVIMLMVVVISTYVYAAPSATMKLEADKTSLKEGDEVTVTLQLNSVSEIENGIFACEGVIDYDKNIFETATAASYKNGDNWSGEFNPNNNKFAATGSVSGTGHKTGAILSLKLKVKASVITNNTTITVKNIKVTDDNDNEVSVGNASVTISVTGTATNNINNNSNNNGSSSSGSQTTGTGSSTTSGTTTDKTTSSTSLPKTGVNQYVIIGIAIVAIVAVISIVRYKNIMK